MMSDIALPLQTTARVPITPQRLETSDKRTGEVEIELHAKNRSRGFLDLWGLSRVLVFVLVCSTSIPS